MGFDEEQDGISLGELDSVSRSSDAEAEAAATEEVDDSQLSEGDAMRRRSAERREQRSRRQAQRRELRAANPDTGRGRRCVMIGVAVALCASLAAGGVYYYYYRGQNAGGTRVAGNGPDAGMDFGNISIISATGTTSIGMSMETFRLNLSDVDLTIDEVYVSSRDEVTEGQPILKINEDSIKNARIRLQQTAQSAEYAYQLGVIEAEEDVVTAKDTYQQALIALEYAEQDYADTIAEAQAGITSLESQIEDQQELVDEYQAAVDDDEYYSKKYKVPELKAQLEKDQTLLNEIYYDDSTGVADHLDYLYGGSYEAYLNGETGTEDATEEQSESEGEMSGEMGGMGGMDGFPGGGGGDFPGGPPSGGDGAGNGSADHNGSGTGGGSTSDSGSSENGSTGDASGSGSSENGSTGDTSGDSSSESSADSGSSGDSSEGSSSTDGGSDTAASSDVSTQSDDAEILISSTSSELPATSTSSTGAAASAGTSMPGSTSGATSGSTSSNSSGSSGSSSSGSATISDAYSSSSSDTAKSTLSTSSLSTSDLTTYPWYSAYVALDEEVTEETEEYEEAVSKAEKAQKRASSLLSQAQNKLESLQLQLRTAQNELVTTQEEAQETLDTVKAEAAAAEETYNTSIRSIENTTDTLQDAMEVADENLASFEEQIGDGYLYTSNAGTIMMVGVQAGETLTYNEMVAAYTDPGSISVTAAVDQSNIASIAVGDTVAVVFEEAGIYQGYVAAINPVTQSSSRTSVSYSVTVELEGDVSDVEENISATVYFGDAVPMVFQQAGDQLHAPESTASDTASDTVTDAAETAADTASEENAEIVDAGDRIADGDVLETLIDDADAAVESGEIDTTHGLPTETAEDGTMETAGSTDATDGEVTQ